MAGKRKPDNGDSNIAVVSEGLDDDPGLTSADGDEEAGDLIAPDTLVCALTGELVADKPEERVLQSLIEQLHREYRVELSDMTRDVKLPCVDSRGKKKTATIAIVWYEHEKPHDPSNIIRAVLVGKANAMGSERVVGQ